MKIRRFVAIDDCGNIINPMIVQGQVHGGLTMGMAPALLEEISYDESGNVQGGFAAYGGALGTLGLSPAASQWLVEPLIAVAAMSSFGVVTALSMRRREVMPPLVSAAGALMVLAGRFALDGPAITAVGALLLVAAALANATSCRRSGSRSQPPR